MLYIIMIIFHIFSENYHHLLSMTILDLQDEFLYLEQIFLILGIPT